MARHYLKICILSALSVLTFVPPIILFWGKMVELTKEETVNECNIPVLNPFDAAIMPYHNKIKIKCKNPTVHLVRDDFDYLMLADEPFLMMNQLNCCYTPYVKIGNKWSDRRFADYCESIEGKVKAKHDFVKVLCKYHEHTVYMDYADFVLSNTKFPPVKKQSNYLNVIILLLDGVSRMAFHRQLPETKMYLKKLDAIEFTKFMRVGENSFPNVMALLTGYQKRDYHKCWLEKEQGTFDDCPFIWKTFSNKKFLTAFVEDAGYTDTFDHEKKGFLYDPVDYYWRSFDLLLNEIKSDPQNAQTPFIKACAGDRPVYRRFFNYAKKFFKRMMKDEQKFFAFFHSNSVSHDDNTLLASIDLDLRNLFMELKRTGVLRKTAVFFLSDHGSRYGDIRKTYQGFFEVNLPFLFVYLPEQFKNKYVSLYTTFKKNSNRLTSAFDIHETLHDIVSLDYGSKINNCTGTSLFREIPTTRSCEQAGIPLEFCVCAQNYIVIDEYMLRFVAGQTVVNWINELITLHSECASLSLLKVADARYIKYWSNDMYLYQLKVIIHTHPGTGIFEAILRETNDVYVVLGTVSRLSTYGKESSCTKNTTLKLYCYCHYGIN